MFEGQLLEIEFLCKNPSCMGYMRPAVREVSSYLEAVHCSFCGGDDLEVLTYEALWAEIAKTEIKTTKHSGLSVFSSQEI